MTWAGFDGRAYTREQWVAHVAQTPIYPGARRVVQHSTGIPTLRQWLAFDEAAYIRNAQVYYENQLGWAHGPHGFASYKSLIGFSSLSTRGTHASCFNGDSLGFECGINRNTEDWRSGPGALALANQHFMIAVVMVKMRIKPTPDTYLPHSACRPDGHFQCPIENFEQYRAQETADIVAFMNALGDKLPENAPLAAQATPVYPVGTKPVVGSIAWVQASLNAAGAKLVVDGDAGPATAWAVRVFQQRHGLAVDGLIGPQTLAALRFYAAGKA